MTRYAIAEPRVVRRVPLGDGGAPDVAWEVKPGAATAGTPRAAKAAYMRALDPALRPADDKFAAAHFDRHARAGYARCVRMPEQETTR